VWGLLTVASLLAGCRDEPSVVVDAARAALEARDEDAFLALCEPRAADLIRRGELVQKRSGRMFKVLRDGKPTTALLPKGDLGETVESGHRAVVEVKKGDLVQRVPLRLVRGQWKVDLMEMDLFLDAMQPRAD
jgi:hypothetical protein